MSHVLVAGGAGYIGAHMCRRLHAAGHLPIVLDDLSTGNHEAVLWGPFVYGSLEDQALVGEVLAGAGIDVVMHFAASSQVGESVEQPYAYYHNNVAATLGLLETMRRHGVERFIFSSTAAVFGEPETGRVDETHPRQPLNPYGRSKLAVEHMIEDATEAYGLRAACLRYFNAAGAAADGLIGESREPETHLIPRLLRRAAGEPLEVCVYGSDYPTPDGSCIRDYVHVCDLADAHLAALELIEDEAGFHDFNLGNGDGYSVFEVLETVEDEVGLRLDVSCAPRRPGDPAVLVADGAKARTVLGWQPRRGDLGRIVADAWRWHRKPRF